MKFKKSWALGAVSAAVFAIVVPFAPHAAAVTPPFEPDPNAANGSISFYDASGNLITGGTDLAHLFDYAVASSPATRSTTKAQTTFAFPDHTKPDSTTWFQAQSSAATVWPNGTYPGVPGTTTNPVAHAGVTEANLGALLATTTLDTTTGYAGIVQIRLKDSGIGIGNGILASPFWATDISFNAAAGTWTQVYPAPPAGPTATTTTLGITPVSPQVFGTNVTLNATVAPLAAGTVQFKDGGANLGSAVAVSAGHASTSTTTLTVGTHSLTAVFTPTDATAFSASTSSAISYTITSAAATTTTTLAITPPSPITVGTVSTLTATVSPSDAVGSVQFVDGATNIGTPVAVSSGTAAKTTTFTVNTHSVKAVFTPTDSAAFTASQSAVSSYVVNAVPATATTTTLGVTPSSPQVFGTSLTLTGTVSPSSAVGSIQFLDGTTVIGSGTVSGGVGTASTSALAAGTHALTAKFLPANSADFGTSQSAQTSFSVTKAPSTTTLGVSPASGVVQGTSVTLTATITPSTVPGTVQFFDGASPIGLPVAVASGTAHVATTSLNAATHTLTAQFLPASPNYDPSTSNAVSYLVNPPPPGSTTTVLSVTPGGPVSEGTVETLKATVTPAAAAGTVQFLDGTTPIGSAVAVTGGVAQTTTTLPQASHVLTAHFVSGNTATFNDSTSAEVNYLVKPPPTPTTTTLVVTPSGPVSYGTAVALTASVDPSAAGTIAFKDGPTVLSTKPVVAGSAVLTTVGLSGGSHSLTATFTPTTPLDFAASTSAASVLSVTALDTTTALAVTPAGPVTVGATATLTATITPATAAGSVTFRNGTTSLGTVAVSGGKAVLKTTKLSTGTASLTATFTGTVPANFNASDSAPVTLEVDPAPVIGSITSSGGSVSAGSNLLPGQTLTVHASGFQPDETVTVVVHSAPTTLGTATATNSGDVTVTVKLPSSLAAGAHTLNLVGSIGTAVFRFSVAAGQAPTTSRAAGSGVADLASTGVDVAGGIALGFALLTAGCAAIAVTRRRRGLHHAR